MSRKIKQLAMPGPLRLGYSRPKGFSDHSITLSHPCKTHAGYDKECSHLHVQDFPSWSINQLDTLKAARFMQSASFPLSLLSIQVLERYHGGLTGCWTAWPFYHSKCQQKIRCGIKLLRLHIVAMSHNKPGESWLLNVLACAHMPLLLSC